MKFLLEKGRGLSCLLIGTAAAGLGFFSPSIQARPIVGDIDFGGMVSFNTLSLATATQVNQRNSSFALEDSGDFATFIDPTTHPAALSKPF